jgi:hypothetical protein
MSESVFLRFHVCGFVQEQAGLDNYLYEGVTQHYPDLKKRPYLQMQGGRPSKAKVIFFCISAKKR